MKIGIAAVIIIFSTILASLTAYFFAGPAADPQKKEISTNVLPELITPEPPIGDLSGMRIQAVPQANTADLDNREQESISPDLKTVIQDCVKTKNSAGCLDAYFKKILEKKKAKIVLADIDSLQSRDESIRLQCHEIVHAVGRETFQKAGAISAAFQECDQTCHSGCFHGAVERFLKGPGALGYGTGNEEGHLSEKEIQSRIVSACSPNEPVNLRFQCLHGLGHAVVFFLDYDLIKGLSWCDALPGGLWSQRSCWGGAFMENITAAEKSKRFLSKTDSHFPCSVIDEKYKDECYMMQTSRMLEMGLGDVGIADECEKAGPYRLTCMQSFGRDKSNDARVGKYAEVAGLCSSLELETDKEACIRGVSYALIDNTWDGKYAFPFCEALAPLEARPADSGTADATGVLPLTGIEKNGETRYCYGVSINYLISSILVKKTDILAGCTRFVPVSDICREIAGK